LSSPRHVSGRDEEESDDETVEESEDETVNASRAPPGCNREDDDAVVGGRSVSGLIVWLFFIAVSVIVIACTAGLMILATPDVEP